MTMTRSGFLNLLLEGLSKVFHDQYKDYPTQYQKVYNVQKSSQYKETLHSVAPLGGLTQKAESGSIEYEDMVDGYSRDHAHVKPQVINGESLNLTRGMVTLSKQAQAVQLQRLNPVAA
jgi:hypothetical protein